MDPSTNPYYNYSMYYQQNPIYYNNPANKRDLKAFDKESDNVYEFQLSKAQPLGSRFSKPKTNRWEAPISTYEIQSFYTKYKDFIGAAKQYRAAQFGDKYEPVSQTVPSVQPSPVPQPATASSEPKRVYELLGQLPSSTVQNMTGKPITINSSQAQPSVIANSYFSNLNLNSLNSKPVVDSSKNTFADYSNRAFKKCLTVNERMVMSKILQQLLEANQNSNIDWNSRPLPLLPREKVFEQAKTVDDKISQKQKRLQRFQKDSEGSLLHNISIEQDFLTTQIIGT